ncbi:MAG: class I SAM-dependent methyltransferase [Candidatus Paceibacterota bacterium]
MGYKISKVDIGEYTYRDDLYSLILKKYSPLVRGKVLDVGAGPTAWAKKMFGKSLEVITFDQSGEVDVHGDLLAAPFPDNSFDCIFCFETIEHVKDPFKAVSEMRRMLKPGGMLVASTPFIHELHGEDYGDYWRITRQAWALLLRDFKDVEITHFGKEMSPHHYLVKGIK